MANHYEIVPGGNGETHCVVEPVSGENCTHIEVVGHDKTIETELIAQQIRDNSP